MKKRQYISPAVEICRVQASDLMSASTGHDIYIEMEIAEEEYNGEFHSKQGFFDPWDEEE